MFLLSPPPHGVSTPCRNIQKKESLIKSFDEQNDNLTEKKLLMEGVS